MAFLKLSEGFRKSLWSWCSVSRCVPVVHTLTWTTETSCGTLHQLYSASLIVVESSANIKPASDQVCVFVPSLLWFGWLSEQTEEEERRKWDGWTFMFFLGLHEFFKSLLYLPIVEKSRVVWLWVKVSNISSISCQIHIGIFPSVLYAICYSFWWECASAVM